jgi:hypothetical protein
MYGGKMSESFRSFFAGVFAQFLRENFRTAAHVAVAFGVTERTAVNWMEGTNCPSGHVVGYALTEHPLAPQLRAKLERAAA